MTIAEISMLVSLIATGLTLVGTLIGFIVKIVNFIRNNEMEKMVERLMIEAEKLQLTGEEKKKYVMNGVVEWATKIHANIVSISEKASSYIEECIAFSKQINSK